MPIFWKIFKFLKKINWIGQPLKKKGTFQDIHYYKKPNI
jgi:hypothetical protein